MKEKERYVIRYDLDYNQCLIDTEENQGVGDYIRIVKLLNQQDKRIKELEKQLAESEKQIKDARETANMSVDSWCKNRRKYEAQIAEMQNKSFILYSMLYETLEKQGCENVASQIDQMTGWTYDKEADWLKGNRNYDQLKQQLEEKEKLIERLQGVIDKLRDKKFAGKTLVEAVNAVYEPLFKNKCDEVEEFKQQLHELPKKIVEEIKDKIPEIGGMKCEIIIDDSLTLNTLLGTILQKYGDKDESNND